MARRRIAVVADSACDLPADLAASRGIGLVPLTAHLGPGAVGVAVVRQEAAGGTVD